MRLPLLVFALSLLALAASAGAQPLPSPEEGAPRYNTPFGWLDYGQHNQNWGAAQDPRGLVYVGNSHGLMEYDGGEWRKVPFPEGRVQIARSLAVGPGGRVYVGGLGEIDELETDPTGTLRYTSLLAHLPEAHRDFADVWTTHATERGIYFHTFGWIARWDGRQMEVWPAATRFHKAFTVTGQVYVREEGSGLKIVSDSGPRLLPGGSHFAERALVGLAPHPRGLLALVRDEGLAVVTPRGGIEPLEGVASAFLRAHTPYHAVAVPNPYGPGSLYAIATLGGGVLIVDEAGRAVRRYGEDVGLTSQQYVVGIAPDRQGGLWVTLLDGIRRFDLFPRVTAFGQNQGLLGTLQDLTRHDGILYAATSHGVFRLREGRLGLGEAEGAYTSFESVEGVPDQAWSLLSTPDGLLVATSHGIYEVQGERARAVTEEGAFSLLQARSKRVYAGLKEGLAELAFGSAGWSEVRQVPGVSGEIRAMDEDDEDRLWLSPIKGGLIRLDPSGHVTTFAAGEDGLPLGTNSVMTSAQGLILLSQTGVLRIAEGPRGIAFEPFSVLGALEGNYHLHLSSSGHYWVKRKDDAPLRRFRLEEGGVLVDDTPPGIGLRDAQVNAMRDEGNGVVWVGTESGLLRYDGRLNLPAPHFPAFVRRVTDRQRTTLFGGAYGRGAGYSLAPLVADFLTRPFQRGGVRFEFAAAAYADTRGTEYQFFLDGFDEEWTPWAPERQAEYTNLPEKGRYTFRVRARDIQGFESEVGTYEFRVLPPWYRSPLAYLCYALLFIGVVWGVSAWRLRKHRRRAEAQRIVSLRLDRLSERLKETNARLRDTDRLKDELLANTSHELRTPLTAILGFTEILLAEVGEDLRDIAEAVQRGGQRLLQTVNGLLDMAKLQAGTLETHPAPVDVTEVTCGVVRQLGPLAVSRGLYLCVLPETSAQPATADAACIDRVLTNLVGNAIKFTETGGVAVLVDGDEDEVRITVRDTGIGIAPDFLPRLYLPFEQASQGYERSHEGTGLGMAIVKQTVDLMGGTISVASTPGEGTSFTVVFPRHAGEVAPPAGSAAEMARASALSGARVLALHADPALLATLQQAVEPYGRVVVAETLGRALREARTQAFDLVVAGAVAETTERKWMRALRHVPGYATAAVLRVGEPLAAEPLAELGYSHQTPVPLDRQVFHEILEQELSHIETSFEEF